MKRIFATGISQESNSFNPLKSTYDDFVIYRGQEFRDTPGLKVLIDAGFDVVESIWPRAVPGGTLNFEDFKRFADEMLTPLEDDRKGFDAVFLPMHGALDVEHIGSGEAYIIARIREIVGQDIPIAAALDMHANIMYGAADAVNIIYGYRTAPHIDVAETHIRAAELLVRALNEGVTPRTKLLRIPYMMPGENMMTSSGIGKEIIEKLPLIEKHENIWCASYFVGMAWIDCYQNGAAVVVSGVGDMSGGIEEASKLKQFVLDNRSRFQYQGNAMEPEEIIDFVKKHSHDRPVIISDSADNKTAGAAGDNAFMLDMFLRSGVENAVFASIIDPEAIERVKSQKIGDVIDIEIGGAFDQGSKKVAMKGAVIKNITLGLSNENSKNLFEDKPRSCVLNYKGIDVLIFDKRKPVFDESTLAEHGLSLSDYNILVVKQGYLSPELLEAAKHSAMALTPGNCNQKIERLTYKKIRHPMYPFDEA
ncbi:MAG: M81 family metallopeptidase [Oscillospiraceae bacterium]|nr:M81 family metallopeptidase [Oscillospiraceae bacterium]